MITINLLPAEGKRRAAPRSARTLSGPGLPRFAGDPWMAMLALAGIVVLVGVGFLFWQTGTRQTALAAEIDREVADSVRFGNTIELLTNVRAREDTIQQKIAVIRSVDTRRYQWPHLLDEVSRALPPFTWLTSIVAAEAEIPAVPAPVDSAAGTPAMPPPPVGPSFTVEGNSGSTQALTRFMKSLEDSPFVREVTLVTSEQVTEQGRDFQKFTLEARYEEPDSAFVQTTPVVSLR